MSSSPHSVKSFDRVTVQRDYRLKAKKVANFIVNKILKYIKQLAPWAVAVGIFYYLFRQYPPSSVLVAIRHVDKLFFFSFAIGYFLFIYVVDAWVMTKVITRFSHAVKFSDMLVARGVTYLIMIINYPASQAAYGYFLKRKYNIPIFQAFGIFFFIIFIDFMWVITLALVGSFFQDVSFAGVDFGSFVRNVALAAYAGAALWIAFWRRLPELAFGRKQDFAFLKKLRERRIFHIFNRASLGDYARVMLMRAPIHITIIFFMYVVILTFGASIPFVKILGNVPVVFLIGTLPITPGGLGTTNAAMVALLAPYVSGPIIAEGIITAGELIFASMLLWMFVNYACKAILGAVLLLTSSKGLFAKGGEEDLVERTAPKIHENF